MLKYEKSFASHPRAKYWSDRNKILPEDVALNTHKKYWFNCDKCEHEFEAVPNNIFCNNTWCPYCYNRKLCKDNNCVKCFNTSFASHYRSKNWSNENNVNPRDVIKGSDKKYYFDCDVCNHKLYMSLKKVSLRNQFCKYCMHTDLCDNNNCNLCFNNSFASIDRCKYLVDKNVNSRKTFKNSSKKLEFKCDKCSNNFTKIISNVTRGVWCPHCYNKTEDILYNFLNKTYTITRQYKNDWCKNALTNKYLPFDFLLDNYNIIIELDGPQHIKQVSNWQSHLLTQENDKYKMKCANENGYSVLRILQKDVWHNRYDWKTEILDTIQKIIDENVVQNIFMCKTDEYSYLKND